MSTNAPARPQSSRRTFLSVGAAALAGASTVATVSAIAATQDPALTAATAERQAWGRYSDLVYAEGEAEEALWASEWHREPRVLVAEYTSIVRGPDLEQIPFDEWVAKPIYVHTHAEIDRDCDSHARAPDSTPEAVEERRVRFHRALDLDAAAIAAAPITVAAVEAARLSVEALRAWEASTLDMVATVPTTPAGLLAILQSFEAGIAGNMIDPDNDGLTTLMATIRTFIGGRA